MFFPGKVVGEIARNEDGYFVAQILAVDRDPMEWIEIAISDCVRGSVEKFHYMESGATLKDTGRYDSNRHRIIRVDGSSFLDVWETTNAFCDYICLCLSHLKEGVRSDEAHAPSTSGSSSGGSETEKISILWRSDDDDEDVDDFVLKEVGGSTKAKRIEMELGATVIYDEHLVSKVVGIDLQGQPKWVELAITRFLSKRVDDLSCYCPDPWTKMKDTGRRYKEGRILRIESYAPGPLVRTINKLSQLARGHLSALTRDLTEGEKALYQRLFNHAAKKRNDKTGDELMQGFLEARAKTRKRYNEQRGSWKEGNEGNE